MNSYLRNDTDKVFYSKIDAWLGIVIIIAMLIVIVACIVICVEAIEKSSLKLIAISLLFLLFEIPLFLLIFDAFIRCRYIFAEDYLYIQSGIFAEIKIPYKDIISFCETNSTLSAPACSLDRIKIVYKNKMSEQESFILVSPKNKRAFSEKLDMIIKENV